MKADKLILATLIAISVVKFFAAFPLDNTLFPGGTDVAHFLSNSWYIATHDFTKWNYFWYGGFPFLRYYPPLAFLLTGFVGRFIGVLLAYKLVNDLFLILSTFAFYAFLQEFDLSREKKIIALIVFSFFPIFAYFLADGRFSSLVNIFFLLLYWKFLKRSLDDRKFSSICVAALLLSVSLVTHLTTTFLFGLLTTAWAFIYKTKYETLKKLLAISVLAAAMSAWFYLPSIIEGLNTSKSNLYQRVVGNVYVSELAVRIQTSVIQSEYYASNYETYLLVILVAFTFLLTLLSLGRYKNKTTRDFILTLIFLLLMLLFVRYERSMIFLSIPFAFLVPEGLGILKKNLRIVASILFVAIIVASYLLIRPQLFAIPNYPNIPRDGRVIFLPFGSAYADSPNEMKHFFDVIISPMNGQENIFGWFDESQIPGKSAAYKFDYMANLSDPLQTTKDDYYKLLNAGYVNYVVINRNATDLINYFKNPKFTEIFSGNMFVVYQLSPKSTYVEVNGQAAQSSVQKLDDKIEIDTKCENGAVVIKESYHDLWTATINDSPTPVSFDGYGFIQLNSTYSGTCKIVLRFENPNYYLIFYIVSIAAMIFVLFNILKKF